jgi:hypothetical protein
MSVSVVILVGVAAAGIGFLLGYWVGFLARPKGNPAGALSGSPELPAEPGSVKPFASTEDGKQHAQIR